MLNDTLIGSAYVNTFRPPHITTFRADWPRGRGSNTSQPRLPRPSVELPATRIPLRQVRRHSRCHYGSSRRYSKRTVRPIWTPRNDDICVRVPSGKHHRPRLTRFLEDHRDHARRRGHHGDDDYDNLRPRLSVHRKTRPGAAKSQQDANQHHSHDLLRCSIDRGCVAGMPTAKWSQRRGCRSAEDDRYGTHGISRGYGLPDRCAGHLQRRRQYHYDLQVRPTREWHRAGRGSGRILDQVLIRSSPSDTRRQRRASMGKPGAMRRHKAR